MIRRKQDFHLRTLKIIKKLEEQSRIIKLKLFVMIIGIRELVGHGLFLTMKVMRIL